MHTHSGRSERSAGPGMLLPELKLCTAGAILAPDIPLLEKIVDPDRGARWAPRAFWQIELIATAAYRARVDVGPLYDALWRAAQSLNAGQPLMAWAILGEMRGRAYPDASAALRAREAHRLIGEGQLTKDWDEAKHPRHPAGSPNSTGGQFAPKDGEEENGTLVPEEGGSGKPFDEQPPSRHRPPQGIPQVATLGEEEDGGGGETAAPPPGDGSGPEEKPFDVAIHQTKPPGSPPPPGHNRPPPGELPPIPFFPGSSATPSDGDFELPGDRERRERLREQGYPKTFEEMRVPAPDPAPGFSTHDKFVSYNGPAPEGMQYHHVVEQNPKNLEQFGPIELHNADNVIPIPTEAHRNISAHYSSKPDWTGGSTVRDWLSQQSFEAQNEYGLQRLRIEGVLK